jgi:adenylate cyclase
VKGILKRSDTGEEIELANVSIVGRSSECQVIVADPRVSRRHAMIRKQDGGFYLFDLGSFNGSYLNGARVTAARQLKTGDVIGLADHEFQFEQAGEVADMDMESMGGSTIALIRSTPVIILVSDIMGFTALSEAVEADALAQIMGSWYSDCEQILAKEGGTVDKFIGDCVLAYWTTVDANTIAASIRAAKELLESCNRISHNHPDVFEGSNLEFSIGVALHTGKVAYGGMSQGEFTLVGDPVNLTFRLESLTRELDQSVLVTGDFARMIPEKSKYTKALGVHKVKGRAQGVEVVALTSFPDFEPGEPG